MKQLKLFDLYSIMTLLKIIIKHILDVYTFDFPSFKNKNGNSMRFSTALFFGMT